MLVAYTCHQKLLILFDPQASDKCVGNEKPWISELEVRLDQHLAEELLLSYSSECLLGVCLRNATHSGSKANSPITSSNPLM